MGLSDSEKKAIDALYDDAVNKVEKTDITTPMGSMGVNEIALKPALDRYREAVNREVNSKEDGVNSPSHYKVIDGIECVDIIMELLGPVGFIDYCYGNVLKYTMRAKKKENFMKDLNKAAKYIEFIK